MDDDFFDGLDDAESKQKVEHRPKYWYEEGYVPPESEPDEGPDTSDEEDNAGGNASAEKPQEKQEGEEEEDDDPSGYTDVIPFSQGGEFVRWGGLGGLMLCDGSPHDPEPELPKEPAEIGKEEEMGEDMPIPSLADLLDRLNEDEAVDASQAEREAVAEGPALKCRESSALRSNDEPWYTQLAKSRAREKGRIETECPERTVVSAKAVSSITAPSNEKGLIGRERLTFGSRRTGEAPPKHKAKACKAKAAPSRGSVMLPGSRFDASQRADGPWSLQSNLDSRASASSAPAFSFSSTSSSAGSGQRHSHQTGQKVGPGSMKSLLARSCQTESGDSAAVCGPATSDGCQSVFYSSPECQPKDWPGRAQHRDPGCEGGA